MSAYDTHRIYLECVRPDIGKKGINKYYLVERNGYKVTIKYGSINQKNSDGIPIKGTTTVKTFPSVQKASIFMAKQVNGKTNPRGKTMKDTKTQKVIPKPPYEIVSEEKGFFDTSTLRGLLGIMNHASMDMV